MIEGAYNYSNFSIIFSNKIGTWINSEINDQVNLFCLYPEKAFFFGFTAFVTQRRPFIRFATFFLVAELEAVFYQRM